MGGEESGGVRGLGLMGAAGLGDLGGLWLWMSLVVVVFG